MKLSWVEKLYEKGGMIRDNFPTLRIVITNFKSFIWTLKLSPMPATSKHSHESETHNAFLRIQFRFKWTFHLLNFVLVCSPETNSGSKSFSLMFKSFRANINFIKGENSFISAVRRFSTLTMNADFNCTVTWIERGNLLFAIHLLGALSCFSSSGLMFNDFLIFSALLTTFVLLACLFYQNNKTFR